MYFKISTYIATYTSQWDLQLHEFVTYLDISRFRAGRALVKPFSSENKMIFHFPQNLTFLCLSKLQILYHNTFFILPTRPSGRYRIYFNKMPLLSNKKNTTVQLSSELSHSEYRPCIEQPTSSRLLRATPLVGATTAVTNTHTHCYFISNSTLHC